MLLSIINEVLANDDGNAETTSAQFFAQLISNERRIFTKSDSIKP